jgi:UDP-N-acetylglucosamine 2-epimerase (non-hydrolysing)
MKMAPLLAAFGRNRDLPPAVLVHTGQHYDIALNERLFGDLGLPAPDVNLEVGSGSHAVQTAEVIRRFEPVLDRYMPTAIVVVGDVNSTLACSLVAVKKGVPVVHVEAGLRSFDRSMPEEINRVLTDQVADVLYTTERAAAANLEREGIPRSRIHFAGNVMIDSVRAHLPRAVLPAETLQRAGVDAALAAPRGFGFVTLHRPANVDRPETLLECLQALAAAGERLPLVCALHPRTRANLERFGLAGAIDPARIAVLPPQGYLETLGLMANAALVLTDSGGIQEETTALGVPCLTMRKNTERPITVEEGTNTLVGRDAALVRRLVGEIAEGGGKRGRAPELWDGRAAERIAADLAVRLARRPAPVEA